MPHAIWRTEDMPANQVRITAAGSFPRFVPANRTKRVFVMNPDRSFSFVEETGQIAPDGPDPNPTPAAPVQTAAPTLFRTAITGEIGYDIGTVTEYPASQITVSLAASATPDMANPVPRVLSGNVYKPVSTDNSHMYLQLSVFRNNGVGQLLQTSAVFTLIAGDFPAPVVAPPVAIPNGVPTGSFPQGAGSSTFNAATGFSGESLTYSLVGATNGATINSSTGVVTVPTASVISPFTLTIRATNSAGSVDNTTLVAVNPATVSRYLIPDNMWIAEQDFTGALGRRRVRVDPSQPMPTGHELVWYSGPDAGGRTDQTRVINIGDPATVSNGTMAVGAQANNFLYWRERTGGTDAAPVYAYYSAIVTPKVYTIANPTSLPQIDNNAWSLSAIIGQNGAQADVLVNAPATISKVAGTDTAGANGSTAFRVTTSNIFYQPWVQVKLPAGYSDPANASKRWPVIYYLPGQSASLNAPFTMAALANADAIVVGFESDDANDGFANGGNGWYVNANPALFTTLRWTDFFLNDLIPYIDATYRTNGASQRIVMGNSMGAFGAMNAVAERPELFGAVIVLSGGVSDYTHPSFNGGYIAAVLGPYDATIWGRWDVVTRLQALRAANRALPPIYICTGQAPGDVEEGVLRFRQRLIDIGMSEGNGFDFEEVASQDHSYGAPRDGAAIMVPRAMARIATNPASGGSIAGVPSGYEARASFGATLPNPPTVANTTAVTPGVTRRMPATVGPNQTAVANLYWRNLSTDAMAVAAVSPKSFVVPNTGGLVTVVSTVAQLYNIVTTQTSGAIELAPGNYGAVQQFANIQRPAGVTIRPQNRNNPPVFVGNGGLYFNNCSGFTIDGLTFAPTQRNAASVNSGNPMLEFQSGSNNCTVVNCWFFGANFNLVLRNAENCLIAWNTFEASPQDYIRIFEYNRGHVIRNNRFLPFIWDRLNYPNAHPDMIQLSVTGLNRAPRDITIQDNFFQMLLMGNERPSVVFDYSTHIVYAGNYRMRGGQFGEPGGVPVGAEIYNTAGSKYEGCYRNIQFLRNYVEGTHVNGFGFDGTDGTRIEGNVFRQAPGTPGGSGYSANINFYRAGDATANRNVYCRNNVTPYDFVRAERGTGTYLSLGTAVDIGDNIVSPSATPVGWVTPVAGRYAWNNGVPA